MMSSFVFLCCFLLLFLFVQKGSTTAQVYDTVYEVSAANFDEFVTSSPIVLLEFYAPWCGHCQKFAESYRTIGTSLSTSSIRVGKVNSATNQALAARFAIQAIPVLFVIKGGSTAYRYSGVLSHDPIVHYVKSGHQNDDSLPLWSSPMGPFGKMKGLLITIGLRLYAMPTYLSEKYGLSPLSGIVIAVIIVAFVLVVLLFSTVYLTL